MSGPLRIREAKPTDEPALRELSEAEMPGTIRMSLAQSPDFFAAECLRGETRLGILTDDSDAVLGCGARVVRRAWFNGEWRRTGYYCTLRAFDSGRNARAVVTAFAWARQVEESDPLPVITATIMSGNGRARRLLTSRRFRLPAFIDAGEITTFTATPKALKYFGESVDEVEVLSGDDVGETDLREFYSRNNQPLFPELPEPLPAGIELKDFIVIRRNGKIVASAALWNQRAMRQVIITGYAPWLAAMRPLANAFLALMKFPKLPKPGTELRFRYLAFRKIDGDDGLLRLILRKAGEMLESDECLSFSLHGQDCFLPRLKGLKAIRVSSRLYTLSYDENPQPVDFGGAPYIEAAML